MNGWEKELKKRYRAGFLLGIMVATWIYVLGVVTAAIIAIFW